MHLPPPRKIFGGTSPQQIEMLNRWIELPPEFVKSNPEFGPPENPRLDSATSKGRTGFLLR